ncbi:DUF488 domain-containing protein [Dysgonomonas capnocytophagoides]|uniref:DUF488 domain-containing protein n=1 Tax=Dysgonomonas capnocytophagoides TaxID=45254 RepID=A0A4Y8L5G4_9BACT|nr:DUF488 domain-containing protein [Dysgonomonas capnocytophagoides]TFD97338.1 DUF488 domain-containing protein [Dysgonomonas capnocytophagoides]
MESTIYSIGHGTKKMETLIKELQSFCIEYLIDIRTKPYSKWNPQFNQENLKNELCKYNIKYVFLGEQLGGLPDDRTCYNDKGRVAYELIKEKDFFKKGLNRLITANNKSVKLAIMCSESKPEECHRSKLIGEELLKYKISVKHIISENKTKSQEIVISEFRKGLAAINLFGEKNDLTSRKSY